MNCRQAKSDIALWIGEDLPDRSRREELRRHVSACSGCRTHYRRLKGTLQVLEHADREQTYDVSDSVWPELARRIEQQTEPGSHRARFNGWLPFVAVTAACIALLVVMQRQGPRSDDTASDPLATGVFDIGPILRNASDSSERRESDRIPATGLVEGGLPETTPESAATGDRTDAVPYSADNSF